MVQFLDSILDRIYKYSVAWGLEQIPANDHVIRICKPKHVQSGEILPGAFSPLPDEKSLSVHWLEYFGRPADLAAGFEILREYLAAHPSYLQPQASGCIAALRVGGFAGFRLLRWVIISLSCRHETPCQTGLQERRRPFLGRFSSGLP